MDAITLALRDKGCVIKTAYFENSAIKIGYQFYLYGYRVIYRIERSEMIICYLEKRHKDELPGDFLKLFNFLYRLGKRTNELSIIRMLVIDNVAHPTLHLNRHRLINILKAKGAFSKSIENNDWLVFDVSSSE
ncbi:type III secretion system effector protein SseE [Yersinia aleksiciae]|uniref:pathogenicity island 2 effector protein SseE n=1 Tax=Yersinia aleksiciae TaxID=263819 RepID=UPI00119CE404|nr:pathogenicity island 2 effector protein SseE [Yersinia aleksiciae]MDA5498192.1 pathogenicity island 2 effector protein SseE [Yersinia aleksiciae]NIL00390.1 pathogenicity island 2 effector protein SseE [Yersinia aleksiciae]WQC70442.1 pathogenicity island 2 effector protein SseE [Yersinia aleksiciae]